MLDILEITQYVLEKGQANQKTDALLLRVIDAILLRSDKIKHGLDIFVQLAHVAAARDGSRRVSGRPAPR